MSGDGDSLEIYKIPEPESGSGNTTGRQDLVVKGREVLSMV